VTVALIGSEAELVGAFARAGWREPEALGLRADLGIGESVVLDRPDPTAPVSRLFLFGRKQDLAFEQEVGRSARQRHHVRFWRSDAAGDGKRPLWLGAASFDRGVGLSRTTGQVTHHISPDIDAERDHVMAELAAAGQLEVEYQVSGVGPALDGHNGGGDRYYTDGEIDVGVLTQDNRVATRPPERLANPPAVALKDWAWSQARPLLRRTLAPDGG
jgi:LssY C-terminus